MRKALLILGVALASASPCEDIGVCGQCASTKGNLLGNCRWCPADSQCHAPGSLFNPCSTSQNIVSSDKCTSAPTPQTAFNQQEAIDMTRYSRAAYAETAEVDGCAAIQKTFVTNDFKCEQYAMFSIVFDNHNFTTLSYYGYDATADRIILAFRGSINQEALWEALVTLTEKQIPFPPAPGAMINPFFMMGYQGLTQKMGNDYAWLTQIMAAHPSATVYITGHSLGGAMASLVATELAVRKIVTPVLYTFGQPRTGNGVYAALATQVLPRAYRVVNANDPIPHIPFCDSTCDSCNYGSSCKGDYMCCSVSGTNVHHSTEMWFPAGEYQNSVMCGFKECSGLPFGEDSSCSNKYTLADLALASHSGYWNALNGFCNVAPLDAQPNYKAIPVNGGTSGLPFALIGAGAIVILVLLFGVVVFVRSRVRKPNQVDSFHLLESYSVPA